MRHPRYLARIHDAQSPGTLHVTEIENTLACAVAIERIEAGQYRMTPKTPGLFMAGMPFVTFSPIVQNDPTMVMVTVADSNNLPNGIDWYVWCYQLGEDGIMHRSGEDGFLDNLYICVEVVIQPAADDTNVNPSRSPTIE